MEMTNVNARLGAAALLAVLGLGSAQAAPFGIFDPRSVAMGGTGVSSGTAGNASYFNPALLAAAAPKDRFAIELMASVRAADPQKFADDIDTLEARGDGLTAAINRFNQAATIGDKQATAGSLATALGDFRSSLSAVNNKNLEANLFASPLTIGVPGKTLGWGLYASAKADISAQLVYANSDDALLNGYQTAVADFAASGAPGDLATLLANFGNGATLNDPDYQSRLNVRAVALLESGVSLAHEFDSLDKLAIGITPKAVRVLTIDYSISPQQSEIDLDTGRRDFSGANLDLGLAKQLGSGFKAGLVGKNLISRSYTTALGNTIDLKPQFRAGVSHHTSWTTVAVDLDLTENKPIGFDMPTRFAAVGAEFDVFRTLQLRVGYRGDLTGNYKGIPSVGLGLSLFGVHLDVAVAGREDEEVIVALQLGFRL
jgi:hypothetical protein